MSRYPTVTPGFWYLATPYSKYPDGRKLAFEVACKQAGILTNAGVVVFSPIAHSHPLVIHGNVSGTDFAAWEAFDRAMIQASIGCIVCKMQGWQESEGIARELDIFRLQSKPIVEMEPGWVPAMFLGTGRCTITGKPVTEAVREAQG